MYTLWFQIELNHVAPDKGVTLNKKLFVRVLLVLRYQWICDFFFLITMLSGCHIITGLFLR